MAANRSVLPQFLYLAGVRRNLRTGLGTQKLKVIETTKDR